MQYALLIYSEPPSAPVPPEQWDAITKQYAAFSGELRGSGAMVGGEQLDDAKLATTVRVRDGKTVVTDGPFAETKEEFGGYYIVEAPNLDEAIKWAAKVPGAQWGSIEVRPVVMTTQGMPAESSEAVGAGAAG